MSWKFWIRYRCLRCGDVIHRKSCLSHETICAPAMPGSPRRDPMTDPHADALARAERALREALSAVESALASRPAVRVVHTGGGWQPPPEPVHTCGDRCDELACEVTAAEVSQAHREVQRRLKWLHRFMPEETPDEP